jgi:DMSO/TMAO reductase YedYZ molybdopterin-dependent catalytic subunit
MNDERREEPVPERSTHETRPEAEVPPPAPADGPPAVNEPAAATVPEAPHASQTAPRPAPAEAPEPSSKPAWHAERPEVVIGAPRRRLAAQTRRDFLLFAAGIAASAVGWWWLLPDRAKGRLLGAANRDRLDTLAARVGLSRANRERVLDRTLTFDDDVAEALYSKDRRVRTYRKSDVTRLPNNYHGRTPGPEYLATWRLNVSGLASGRTERLTTDELRGRFRLHEQVTRLVCVEGWSAVAWWKGIRFADLLDAFPPAPDARWAAMRSSVSLDGAGRLEPYYVSIDLETARHPQTLLATHLDGKPLPLAHGAPLRLLAPMKLGLKNIKALTDVAYTRDEPPDYWAERSYSRYDGL